MYLKLIQFSWSHCKSIFRNKLQRANAYIVFSLLFIRVTCSWDISQFNLKKSLDLALKNCDYLTGLGFNEIYDILDLEVKNTDPTLLCSVWDLDILYHTWVPLIISCIGTKLKNHLNYLNRLRFINWTWIH